MRRRLKNNQLNWIQISMATIAWVVVAFCGTARGIDSPGLAVNIFADDDNPDLSVPLGQPIKLIMVIKNKTKFPVNTERGFSKLEPHRYLKLFDPNGGQHVIEADVMSGDAPPPFVIGNKITVPAEKLPANWVKSEIVADLTDLFPVMKDTVGWYTLQAHMPFTQMVFTLLDDQLGLLGIIDSGESSSATRNFEGTLDSNKVQIQVTLPSGQRGAQLKIQVLDQSTIPPAPINQVPVRVYEKDEIAGLTPAQAWAGGPGAATLAGVTNTDGWAVWDKNRCRLEDDYLAIAYFQNTFKEVQFAAGETGWALQCEGVIEKKINFGEPVSEIYAIAGNAFNNPDGAVYKASFLMDVSNDGGPSTGWLKYYYTRYRLYLVSDSITDITAKGANGTISGMATVNGRSGYSFSASVSDGNPDRFGITVSDPDGDIYYSSEHTEISGGDLTVIIKSTVDKLLGDFDNDGDLDGKDVSAFAAAYARSLATADLNDDGTIDSADVGVFAAEFGTVGPSGGAEAGSAAPDAGGATETAARSLKSGKGRTAGRLTVSEEIGAPDKQLSKGKKKKKNKLRKKRKKVK